MGLNTPAHRIECRAARAIRSFTAARLTVYPDAPRLFGLNARRPSLSLRTGVPETIQLVSDGRVNAWRGLDLL